jgi:integrase
MALSDVKIRAAKPAAKAVKLSDGAGLQLVITPAGGKIWKLAYRFGGKQRELTIGGYPAIGLGEARLRRDAAKRQLADGIDPGIVKRLDKLSRVETNAVTFAVVAAELLEKKRREGRAVATLDKTEWLLAFAKDLLGARPVAEITAPEVLVCLRAVERRGRLETARRLRSVIGEVFRYAIATARATNDPTFALRGALIAPKVKHRAAITDSRELGGLMRAIEAFNGQPTTIAGLKLLAMTACRPGELRLASWSEFDLDHATWMIPAGRMKMRREHRVPLSRQAVAELRHLHAITGRGALVLPGYGVSGKAGEPMIPKPISENTMNAALRRLGYDAETVTAHGFRASFSTLANESGLWSSDAIERALAHQDADAIRRAYARGAHWDERVRLMQWWADQLDAWREGGKVIALRAVLINGRRECRS